MMNKDNRGYSSRVISANSLATTDNLGVLLGRYCIAKDISASEIAEAMSVTKMTIYKWFTGKTLPRKSQEERIKELISDLIIT
jgi:predicted DNA-binding protein YlxM (UPF0122 family)